MRIVLSSAWYPVCVGVHLLRAARRAGHEVRTLGPSSGDVMPWEVPVVFGGYGVTPDVAPVDGNFDAPAVLDAAAWCEAWIDVDGGWFFAHEIPAARRVLVLTDPHIADQDERWTGAAQRPFVDRVFSMQSPYCKDGDGWLPYGFDPEWHTPPTSADLPPDYDATNLGAPYPERVDITESLAAFGVRVLGPGRCTIGPEYRRQLLRAPLAIVWPVKDDLPGRVFEALACGRRVVTSEDAMDAKLIGGGRLLPGLHVVPPSTEGVIGIILTWSRDERPRDPPPLTMEHSWDARLAQLLADRGQP